jgi:hypothetical protein
MAKKTVKLRAWTATDIHKMKGLAKKKFGVTKSVEAHRCGDDGQSAFARCESGYARKRFW